VYKLYSAAFLFMKIFVNLCNKKHLAVLNLMIKDVNNIELDIEKAIFWDTDINKIDFVKFPVYIIGRILMYGGLKDWYEIKRFYGLVKIKETALYLRYLDKLTLNFCSMYFGIPKEQFRCCNTPQSVKELWDY
jgi:hypothetical protein